MKSGTRKVWKLFLALNAAVILFFWWKTSGLILFHPIFLVAGYSLASGIGAWAQFIEFITQYPHVIWAFVGLLLFTFVVASSLYISFRRLKYETWYLVHLAVYLAAFASFWHQIANGTDLL